MYSCNRHGVSGFGDACPKCLKELAERHAKVESEFPPKSVAEEWGGKGYPPVGDEVECWDGEEWILGQSVGPYLGGWLCMLSTLERPFVGAEGDFRPLRTKGQREKEKQQ